VSEWQSANSLKPPRSEVTNQSHHQSKRGTAHLLSGAACFTMEYQEFLKSKIKISEDYGFKVDMSEINPKLKPHNKLMVKWLVEGGKRACFASFGLHKTVTQLEAVRLTLAKVGHGSGLIVCPLSVRQEFVEDSKNILGWVIPPKFIRRPEEMDGDGIYLTNYESIRDGKLDPELFVVASHLPHQLRKYQRRQVRPRIVCSRQS